MKKRNRFDTGRFAAAVLAVILISIIPIRTLIGHKAGETDRKLTSFLDGFTSNARISGCIRVSEYEEMISFLNSMELIYSLDMEIEREVQILANQDYPMTYHNSLKSLSPVSVHEHGPQCYAGHNHTASGCRFHRHSEACYCTGKYTSYLRSESGTYTCYLCLGRGVTGSIETCPTCGGVPPDWSEVPCSYCDATGTSYEQVWVVCPYCDGAGCNVCDEGKDGGWYEWDYVTCPVCKGSLTMLKKVPCSTCNGNGTVGEIKTCSNCNGRGSISSSTDYYKCSKCGMGDSSSYGQTCDRRICGMDFESYDCGITNEDTFPICDRIIVDVSYDPECSVRQFDTEDMVDTSIGVKHLDGSEKRMRAKLVSGSNTYNSLVPGELHMFLSLTGYFENAGNYETRYFPITIEVRATAAICDKCGKTYFLKEDGSDPGCPYCADKAYSIRIEVAGDVIVGREPDIKVYAVAKDEEILLGKADYEVFYDTDSEGLQQGAVYYHGIWEYFTINVIPDPDNMTGSHTGSGGTGIVTPGPSGPGNATGTPGEITPTPTISQSVTLAPDDPYGYVGNEDDISPENIENSEDYSGRYIYIPAEEILAVMYRDGVYELKRGDMISITVNIRENGMIRKLLRKFLVPDSLKERYTSGIVI